MEIRNSASVTMTALVLAALSASPALASQDGPGEPPRGDGPGCDLFPAPPSVGASVDISYFGPPPSTVNPSLVGPVQLLKSGTVDAIKGTITLPLYKGALKSGETVWYILTDTDDEANAAALGLNPSSKLAYDAVGARTGVFRQDGTLLFDAGKVDFHPHRNVVPGSPTAPFPTGAGTHPGSVGDADYSPLVRVRNSSGFVYNAPIVAFDVAESQINFPKGDVDYSLVHDEVVAIDPANRTVTLQLINGFSFGRPVFYISMDTNDPAVAAIEGNTYAPLLRRIHTGGDDSFGSGVERIFIATNGAMGCANPQRQGLFAAITDNHRPNNTFGGIPTIALDYSPMWNAQLYEWTLTAVQNGYRGQLREEFQILTYVQDGILTGPGGTPFGDSHVIINCPIVFRLD